MSAKTISRCLLRCVQSLHPLLAVATISVLFASCTRHSAVWPRLLEVEALLETDPHTAGAMIDSIDATPLTGEDAALYAILKTQADYKRDICLTSDSLPKLATFYYGIPYHKNYHAAMAWYSLGCYYTEQISDVYAIDAYLHAKELFPDTLTRYFALTEQNLGKHYLSQDLYGEAMEAFIAYKNQPLCSTDSTYMSYADYLLGMTYLRMQSSSKAKQSFYSVIGNPHSPDYYRTYSHFQLAKILFYEDHDTIKSLSYLNMFADEMGSKPSAALLALQGEILLGLSQPDSAYQCFLRAVQLSDDDYTLCHSYQKLNTLACELQRYDSLEVYFNNYSSCLQKIYENLREEEISRIENDHSVKLYKRKVRSTILFSIALCVVCFLTIVLWVICQKKKVLQTTVKFQEDIQENQRLEMDLFVSKEPDSGSEDTLEKEAVNKEPPAINQDLLGIRRARIELYQNHFKSTDSWKRLSGVDFGTMKAPKINLAFRNQILAEINKVCSNFEWEISVGCPNLTADEILFCSCSMLGLTEPQILFLTDSTHRALIQKKYRIRKKISPEWNRLLFT